MFTVSPETLFLFGIALLNSFVAIMTYLNRQTAINTYEMARKTELNTNSMKDALVAATAKVSHAEGKEEGLIEGIKKEKLAAVVAGPLDVKIVDTDHPVPVTVTEKKD